MGCGYSPYKARMVTVWVLLDCVRVGYVCVRCLQFG